MYPSFYLEIHSFRRANMRTCQGIGDLSPDLRRRLLPSDPEPSIPQVVVLTGPMFRAKVMQREEALIVLQQQSWMKSIKHCIDAVQSSSISYWSFGAV